MLRDSDTKGKKLLFDSMTTQRDASLKKDWTFHDYDQITDGVGYKVPEVRHTNNPLPPTPHPPKKEVFGQEVQKKCYPAINSYI